MPSAKEDELLQSPLLVSLLRDPDDAWDESWLTVRVRKLPPDLEFRRGALGELVKVDLHQRWKRGKTKKLLEAYLREYPWFGPLESLGLDVIEAELQARQQAGDTLPWREVVVRFPRQFGRLQLLLDDADKSWTESWLVDCAEKLPTSQFLRTLTLQEFVKADLRQRWRRGDKRPLDSYLIQYPELGTTDSVSILLIQAEVQARQQTGEPPNLKALAAQYPKQFAGLQLNLENIYKERPAPAEALPADTRANPPDTRAGAPDTRASVPEVDPVLSTPGACHTIPSVPVPRTPDAPPASLFRYELQKELGRGAMGTVYLARDTRLERLVALKIPHINPEDSALILQRFEREARAAAELEHPYICPVYDVGEADGRPYIAMAYIEGRPLSGILRERGRFDQRPAAELVHKLALALQEAHSKGIIHRDLKPSNIMINRRGEPVVMDFGLARNEQDVRLTNLGSTLGTPAYMPAEQLEGEQNSIGPRSDVYSLGVILYELLTGKLPFPGTMQQVVVGILTKKPKPPRDLCPDINPALEAICLKAMAAMIPDRYGSMTEFAQALEEHLDSTSTGGSSPDIKLPDVEGGGSIADAQPLSGGSSRKDMVSGGSSRKDLPSGESSRRDTATRRKVGTSPQMPALPPELEAAGAAAAKGATDSDAEAPAVSSTQTLASGLARQVVNQDWRNPLNQQDKRGETRPGGQPFARLVKAIGRKAKVLGPWLLVALLVAGGWYAWTHLLFPPLTREQFLAEIGKFVEQEKFVDALQEIKQAGQEEKDKAEAHEKVRAGALAWADRHEPGQIAAVLGQLEGSFGTDPAFKKRLDDARVADVEQRVAEHLKGQRYKAAWDAAAAVSWGAGQKDNILSKWLENAEQAWKRQRLRQACDLAAEIAQAAGSARAAELRKVAEQRINEIQTDVGKFVRDGKFVAALQYLRQQWPSDEDQLTTKLVCEQWKAWVEGQKDDVTLAGAETDLAAAAKDYAGDERHKAFEELRRQVTRKRWRNAVDVALAGKTADPDQAFEIAATKLKGKEGDAFADEREKDRRKLAEGWAALIEKTAGPPQAKLLRYDRLAKSLPVSDAIQAMIDRYHREVNAAGTVAKAMLGLNTYPDQVNAAVQALQGLPNLDGGEMTRRALLVKLLAVAAKGVEAPLGAAPEEFDRQLAASKGLNPGDASTLARVRDRLFDRRVHELIPTLGQKGKEGWGQALRDCERVKENPSTWVLACRVECLRELAASDGKFDEPRLLEACETLDKHLNARPLPEATPYARYALELADAILLTRSGGSTANVADAFSQGGGKLAWQTPHRRQRAADILVSAAVKMRSRPFAAPFGTEERAGQAFSWLQLAQQLRGTPGDEALQQTLALAAWYKAPPAREIAGQIVDGLAAKGVLDKIANDLEAYRLLTIHAATRDQSLAGRKVAVARYRAAVDRVRGIIQPKIAPSRPEDYFTNELQPVAAHFYANVIEPLLQKGTPETFLTKAPDQALKDDTARLCHEVGKLIRSDLPLWDELKVFGKDPLWAVTGLNRTAAVLATRPAEKAEYLVAKGYAASSLPDPDLAELKRDAEEACTLAPDSPGGYGLKGRALLLEGRKKAAREERRRLFLQADQALEDALKRGLKKGKDEQSLVVLLHTRAKLHLELGNYAPDLDGKTTHLTQALDAVKTVLRLDPQDREARDTEGCILEDIGFFLGKTLAEKEKYLAEAIDAYTAATEKLDTGKTKPYLDRGRTRWKWAKLLPVSGAGSRKGEANKLLAAAVKDFGDVIRYSPARSIEAVEANCALGEIDFSRGEPERGGKSFERAVKLARQLKSELWEIHALLSWAYRAFEEAGRLGSGGPNAEKYLAVAAAQGAEMAKLNRPKAALIDIYVLRARRAADKEKLAAFARGLANPRPQDASDRATLLALRSELYVRMENLKAAAADAAATLKIDKDLSLDPSVRAMVLGVEGYVLLNRVAKKSDEVDAAEDAEKRQRLRAEMDQLIEEAVVRFREAIRLAPRHWGDVNTFNWQHYLTAMLLLRPSGSLRAEADTLEEACRNIIEAGEMVPATWRDARKVIDAGKRGVRVKAVPKFREALKQYPTAAGAPWWRLWLAECLGQEDDQDSRDEALKYFRAARQAPLVLSPYYWERVAALGKRLQQM